MDCRTALTILEVVRPDSGDLAEPELAAAVEHLSGCQRCAEAFRKRQSVDRRIGQWMRNVHVPADLEGRLLDMLEPATDALPAAAPAGPPHQQLMRRSWLGYSVAASILLLLGLGGWGFVWLTTPTLTLANLYSELAKIGDWNELPVFDGEELLRSLPDSSWESGIVWFADQEPRGLPRNAARHAAALRTFEAQPTRHQRTAGLLLVLLRSSIATPPEESAGIPEGPVEYIEAAGRRFTIVAWSSGEFVFVCGVDGGADDLDQLQRALALPPA